MITPLHMPSLLPHDLCHGRSSSRWPPAAYNTLLNSIVFKNAHPCLWRKSAQLFTIGCNISWGLSSVQFSRSVVSDSLRPHESQHARPPCPSPTPGVHSDSCTVQLSHPYMTTGKTVALTRRTLSLQGCKRLSQTV